MRVSQRNWTLVSQVVTGEDVRKLQRKVCLLCSCRIGSFLHLICFYFWSHCHVWHPIAGGKISGHAYGTWNIPPVISDEESFRRERSSKHDASATIIWWQFSCSKHQTEAQCTLLVSVLPIYIFLFLSGEMQIAGWPAICEVLGCVQCGTCWGWHPQCLAPIKVLEITTSYRSKVCFFSPTFSTLSPTKSWGPQQIKGGKKLLQFGGRPMAMEDERKSPSPINVAAVRREYLF